MLGLDIQNVYSGAVVSPSYPPAGSGLSNTFTPQNLAAGTTYSTNAILHNQGYTPNAATPQQNIRPFVMEPQSLVLQVITAPGDVSAGASYTAYFVTDTNPNLTTNPVVLATLTIPNATVADTYFVLENAPSASFELYSGLKFILVDGTGAATLGVAAWLAPKNSISQLPYYLSGWVIE